MNQILVQHIKTVLPGLKSCISAALVSVAKEHASYGEITKSKPPVCRGDGPLALVLAPTRELAQQIEKEVKAFSRSLESFKTAIVVGGTNIAEQVLIW